MWWTVCPSSAVGNGQSIPHWCWFKIERQRRTQGQQTAMEWHSQKLDGSRNEPALNFNSWSALEVGLRKRSSFVGLPKHVPGQNRDLCSVNWSKRGGHVGAQSSHALPQGVGRTVRSSATTRLQFVAGVMCDLQVLLMWELSSNMRRTPTTRWPIVRRTTQLLRMRPLLRPWSWSATIWTHPEDTSIESIPDAPWQGMRFFWVYKMIFWVIQHDFFGNKNLFLTFSEDKGVSPIVNLFLTFWRGKSGTGVFHSTTAARNAGNQTQKN